MLERRAGLSRSQGPVRPLLQHIKGRTRLYDQEGPSSLKVESPGSDTSGTMEDLCDVPPPEASSDEDDNDDNGSATTQSGPKKASANVSDSNSDSEWLQRNSITATRFKARDTPRSQPTSSTGSSDFQARHLVDKNGFIRTENKSRINKPSGKLARKLTNSYSAKANARAAKDSAKTAQKATNKEEPASPPRAGLKMPRTMSSTPPPTSPKASFKRPAGVMDSPGSPEKKVFRMKKTESQESPDPAPRFRLPGHVKDLVGDVKDPFADEYDHPYSSLSRKDDTNGISRTGTPDDSLSLLEDADNQVLDEEPCSNEAKCPMCHAVVDAVLLQKHTGLNRMNIKQQQAFCKMHQRKEVSSTSQYPKIDWNNIDRRLAEHKQFLEGILEGNRSSHYEDEYERKMYDSEQRIMLKSGESLTPGYYGPKGLRVMTEFIIRELGDVLRRRAVESRLVSSRGHTRYVQSVLVPELAVRLIKEDMGVKRVRAREVLQESKTVGELLNDDTGDVVLDLAGDDDD